MSILTISRKYGSGGREIGQTIATLMNYEYVDRRRIIEDIGKAGDAWKEYAEQYDESRPSPWERFDWSFTGFAALNQCSILSYALRDNAVIIGRGANFLLKNIPHVLRVHVQASKEADRVERIIAREGISRENARWLIEKVDRDMAGIVYLLYGAIWDDPRHYDLVVDTSLQTIPEIATTIRNELAKRKATDQGRQILELRALAANVQCAIAVEPALVVSSLEVKPKEEEINGFGLIVRAVVYHRDDVERIKTVAQKTAGQTPLEYNIQYRWHPRLGRWQFKKK